MPIIQKLIDVYKIWHEFLPRLSKIFKHNLGSKIDILFTDTIENLLIALHRNKEQKLIYLIKASDKLDLLKFFLQVAWEIKAIDNKKYIILSQKLNEIGRMLGGWQKQTKIPQRDF